HVDVRVELLVGDAKAAGLEEPADGGRCDALAEAGGNSPRDDDVFRSLKHLGIRWYQSVPRASQHWRPTLRISPSLFRLGEVGRPMGPAWRHGLIRPLLAELRKAPKPVEPPKGRRGLDDPRERHGLGQR